jgi:hypothetical protein
MECNNLCRRDEKHCEYCQKTYIVSTEFYRARRPVNNAWVIGYLVKTKDGRIEGILNKANDFHELAWIKEETLELYEENGAKYNALVNSEEDERPTLRAILSYRKDSDASFIEVVKQQHPLLSAREDTEVIYRGDINAIPENVLDLEIDAWSRRHGVYISR